MNSLPTIATQRRHQKVTVAALFAAYLAGFGVFLPFFPVWLDAQGLAANWIAVLVAMPLIVRVLTTSFVTDAAERFDDPRLPLLGLSMFAALIFSLLPLAQLSATSSTILSNPFVLLVIVGLMAVGWNAILPLSDALGIQVARSAQTSYGAMRVWGSVSFIVTSFAAGYAVDLCGVSTVPWMVMATFFVLIAVCLSLPKSVAFDSQQTTVKSVESQGSQISAVSSANTKRRSGWVFFLRRKGAISVFIGAGLMQASHAVLYGFGSLSWGNQGFSETMIGLLWAFGVLCEIVLFAVSGPVVAKIGARGLLLLGGIGATLRWCLMAFEPNLAATWGLQVLHAFSFGMTHLAVIAYVSRRARPRELRAAQGVFGVVSGAMMAVATLVAGPLYGAFGAMSYMVMGAMTLVGVLIIFVNRLTVPAGAKPAAVCAKP